MNDENNKNNRNARSSDKKVVKLSGRDVEDAKRLLSLFAAGEYQSILVEPPELSEQYSLSHKQLMQRAREIYTNRRRRMRLFSKAMFDEAAWEILLLLYITEGGSRQTVSKLAQLSGFSKSTALRWLEYLEEHQLVRRDAHPTDRRSAFVVLTDKARGKLQAYLSETLVSNG